MFDRVGGFGLLRSGAGVVERGGDGGDAFADDDEDDLDLGGVGLDVFHLPPNALISSNLAVALLTPLSAFSSASTVTASSSLSAATSVSRNATHSAYSPGIPLSLFLLPKSMYSMSYLAQRSFSSLTSELILERRVDWF